ncbi:MAG: hypothetical protein R2849_08085 [Thermomicrobiales bacterium]
MGCMVEIRVTFDPPTRQAMLENDGAQWHGDTPRGQDRLLGIEVVVATAALLYGLLEQAKRIQ